ncbi:MAG: hypothetical protein K9G67_14430 [Bacteroidales bacterium]|nr:hypothetical protein [Bacteroidales bacterium]MCF8377551.1 hypothetical protein [Bacteroidales bacterium]MCF8401783.1 hypothetical protein [Bacteroidales bacterium]
MKTENKLGFWVALLSALFAVIWFVTFNMQDVFQSVPDWKNLQAYAKTFHISRLTYIYPSLLLAITYLIMLAAIHRIVPEEKKIWSLAALAIGIIYAAMASINYNIQAVAVRTSLATNETGGIEMFLPDNNHSIFTALANSYIYMSLSLFLLGFAFKTGKKEKWIRWLLFAQLISAVGQTAYSMFDASDALFIASSMVWVIGAPAAFVLIALWFRKNTYNSNF